MLNLVGYPGRYFLSRPRRFGKSLTLSTLDAMFSGKAELFKGLAAEEWVREQSAHPNPVLRLDMSTRNTESPEAFEKSLLNGLRNLGEEWGVEPRAEDKPGDLFERIVRAAYRKAGPVVILVDEYDKPVLSNLRDPERAEGMRRKLQGFYTVIKGCEDYLRFVMLTGISKFTKMGVFSAINNLSDISMDEPYGALCGYTQEELERSFSERLDLLAKNQGLPLAALLDKIRDYYDGFCFDGVTKVYNPFSTLLLFAKGRFRNYWYESGSPSFIPDYLKAHHEFSLEKFRHVEVSTQFIGAREIERAQPESFLFQAGYLTIEKLEEDTMTLDYPNREVLESLSEMYAMEVYEVGNARSTGTGLWRALAAGDLAEVKRLFNAALASVPYELFGGANEGFYKAVFLTLLRGAGISALGEVEGSRGRSDVEIFLPGRILVLEFKTADSEKQIERKRAEGQAQIDARDYAGKHAADGREVTTTAFVVDLERRAVV